MTPPCKEISVTTTSSHVSRVTGDNDNQKSSFTGWAACYEGCIYCDINTARVTAEQWWARGPDMLYTFYLSVICCLIPRLATDDEDWKISQLRTDLKTI